MNTLKQFHDAIMGGATRAQLRGMVLADQKEAGEQCPDCEEGSEQFGECPHCDGPKYRECRTCRGTGKRAVT